MGEVGREESKKGGKGVMKEGQRKRQGKGGGKGVIKKERVRKEERKWRREVGRGRKEAGGK